MSLPRRRALATLAGGAALALSRPALAQGPWRPTQPVRIIVPFPPGGTNDLMARPLAEALRAMFDQPVVVENRSGAGGTIGATQVHRAPPDGHTLLVTSAILVTAAIVQPVGWSAVDGFTPVAQIARSPNAVEVHAGLPIRTLTELIEYARARPGEVNYGSVGIGSLGHFMTEALSLRAGIRMTHVPYRGGGQAVTDLASGRLQLLVSTPPPIIGLARDGRVRIIAYTAEGEPAPGLEAPTLKQSGIDMEAGLWFGLFAPPGLPAPILQTLNEASNAALRTPDFARLLRTEGAIPTPVTPAAFAEAVRAEDARWREVARAADIKL
ncbi:MAG TPA: tripartite tricarboxylate transporter substrate binding protein [Falsiroseomonas sp.]|jgi:tripartite-type tricarboxylate transporter receptor subunit TctC|nr:tripartite tricarboxylate transporter substrate binding protein [Falsiroseomonas sp.]